MRAVAGPAKSALCEGRESRNEKAVTVVPDFAGYRAWPITIVTA